MTYDPRWMQRAIRNAEKARGKCSPNPFVGAVIVKNGKLIADGWTHEYGSDHAEIHALKRASGSVKGAEIYVTLEPCSHYGKTPPCALALIKAGIKTAYIGISDPNPLVSGKGIAMLREAGIEVQTGFYSQKIETQLEYFLCRMTQDRPFVIWKMAMSLDGRYCAADGSSRWISGEKSRRYTHKLRSEVDVILTGIGTVLGDDPLLNVRIGRSPRQPVRAIIDTDLQTPLTAKLITTASSQPTLIFCSEEAVRNSKADELNAAGAVLIPLKSTNGLLDPAAVLHELHKMGHYSVLLEAGSGLATSFLRADLIDRVIFFYGNMLLGGDKVILDGFSVPNIADALILTDIQHKRFGDDLMLTGKIPHKA